LECVKLKVFKEYLVLTAFKIQHAMFLYIFLRSRNLETKQLNPVTAAVELEFREFH
jgi:hypothetical protein